MTIEKRQSFSYPTLRDTAPRKMAVLNTGNRLEALEDEASDADRNQVLKAMREFRASQADGLPNPEWQVSIMDGIGYGALRDYERAIAAVEASLTYAVTDQLRGISYNNLSHNLRRSGRTAEAEAAARDAVLLLPKHGGVLCNLALALLRNGKRDEALGVAALLIEISDIEDERTILAAHLKHEAEMRELLELFAN